MNQQIALPVHLNDEARLQDFCWEGNGLLQRLVEDFLSAQSESILYLWGKTGSGKTHLLQACCHAQGAKQSAAYLPLDLLQELGPSVLEGMETQSLVCIDALETVLGKSDWEESLFHLYNKIRDASECRMILAANAAAARLAIKLPDLRSRITSCLSIELQELADSDKINTLIERAAQRGFSLSPSVAEFLLKRCARNMHDLFRALDNLDMASLSRQRKITIPFVKDILAI